MVTPSSITSETALVRGDDLRRAAASARRPSGGRVRSTRVRSSGRSRRATLARRLRLA